MFIKGSTEKSNLPKSRAYKPGSRLSIYPVTSLLAPKQHAFLIEQLAKLSGLSSEQHDLLYKQFIFNFVEFVQVLPTKIDDALGSLMNEGLVRGINALHAMVSSHESIALLERYAVFTAAVLLDIANVVTNQKVFITDEEGRFVEEWRPFEGPLTKVPHAEFYKLMPLASNYLRSAYSITTILARQLLPKEGFSWLTSDLGVFTDWLEALQGEDSGGVGRFVRAIQLSKRPGVEEWVSGLPAVNVTQAESPATVHADAFFAWLKEGLAKKQIKVNTADAGVHVTPGGVFIEKAGVFKQFVDLYVVPVNLFSVFQQFGNLFGLTKLSGTDYRIAQLFSDYPDASQSKYSASFTGVLPSRPNQIREGVLIADPNLVFTHGEIPSPTPYLKPAATTTQSQNLPLINLKKGSTTPSPS